MRPQEYLHIFELFDLNMLTLFRCLTVQNPRPRISNFQAMDVLDKQVAVMVYYLWHIRKLITNVMANVTRDMYKLIEINVIFLQANIFGKSEKVKSKSAN